MYMVNKKAWTGIGIAIAVIFVLAGAYLLLERQQTEDIIVEETVIGFENIKEEIPDITHEDEEQVVINSAEEYEEIFGEETDINFEDYTLIAVFFGQKSTAGYEIEVTEIVEVDGNVAVNVLETYPGDCPVAQVITFPYDVVLTQNIEETPEFVFEETFLEC